MIDPQNDTQLLAYWAAMPDLKELDANTLGAAHEDALIACSKSGRLPSGGRRLSQITEDMLNGSLSFFFYSWPSSLPYLF